MLQVDEDEARILSENKDSILGIRPYPAAYTPEVLKNIKLVNFSDSDQAIPFGSYIYRVQKYPGDIDLVEEFNTGDDIDTVISKFKNKLVSIVQHIVDLRLHYMIEFKMGLDRYYDVNIGTLVRGVYYPTFGDFHHYVNGKPTVDIGINTALRRLKEKNLLTKNELSTIRSTLKKNPLTSLEYDIVYNFFREKRVLRWSDVEILNGKKLESDGSEITIEQALKYNTHVKIDMITKIENKFVEITNFLFLISTVKDNNVDTNYIINFGVKYDKNFFLTRSEIELPKEIEKLFYSDFHYNPFKGAKRMWALARHYNDWGTLNKLKDLISGNISLLYMLKSELGTMSRLLERLIKNKISIPTVSINTNLQLIKERIGYVLNLNPEKYDEFILLLNNVIQQKNIKSKYLLILNLEYLFSEIINFYTISYLKTHDISYINSPYIPDKLSYIKRIGQLI